MRPGPGLVVMALAFISGARRASTTNTISGSSSSSSSSGSGSGGSSSSSIATIITATPTTTATTAPAITTTRRTGTTLPSSYDSATSGHSGRAGGGGGFAFLLPTLHDGSSPGDVAPARDSFQLNFDLYPHSRAPDESLPASSTRRARSLVTSDEARARGSAVDAAGTESVAGAPESSEATLISENEETGEIADREREEQEDQDDNSGLPVQYASSRSSFGEDSDTDTDTDTDTVADEDIFALVAEDDLLSEESFDRLIKLSEDADNAAAAEDEEDYNLAASLALTRQEQQQQQQQQQRERKTEPEPEQQDESRLIDESVLHAKHIENERENANSNNNNNNNKRETKEQQEEREQKEIRVNVNDAYASHLIAIAQRDGGGTLPSAVATTATATATTPATGVSKPVPVDHRKTILGSATALTRLNPWISACDLAQPGITGTDLQGQCSAGTLPMAWVDEGPGPPICPRSCAEQQPTDSSAQARTDNKLKYFINANTINFKSPSNTRLSHNNNYKAMTSRVRRDRQWELEDAVDSAPTEAAATAAASTTEQDVDMDASTLSATSSSSSSSSNDIDDLEDQSVPTLLYSHLQTHEQLLSENEEQQQPPTQQQQQQCLDYLGDAAETSPQHLCGLRSPGQLLARLRSLRLRHCCERSVFSALHTLALNATLEDRDQCVRLLSDLLDVDALANRITCELAEILFRFDCRQVYSLVNQCDDCKEAYRRWVCSTLVPYYAEPQDVDATPADDLAKRGSAGKSKRAARNNASDGARAAAESEGDVIGAGSTADGTGGKHKSQKLISNNNKSNNGNNMNERQINQQHDEDNEPQNKNPNGNAKRNRNNVANVANVAQAFYDVVGIGQHQTQFHFQTHNSNSSNRSNNNNSRGAIAQQQFNNFISTAKNADPSAADPVISKLQKRSTRKAEFRKRRRIRPCLSVCQTVEQKCPYLLPADRAPALPTQYAGEPTFVCLDQNIPETGEQLKKSSYGPNECCYKYCNGPIEGICTICQEFAPTSDRSSGNSSSSSRRVHNITLTMSSPPGEAARAASVSVALRNVSQAEKQPTAAGAELLERLPYYARHDSVYYYDDDEGSDMPELALSAGCAPVPSVTTRCEIPYYASGVAPSPPTQLLVWLSALLGLLSSCGAARQRCGRARSTSSRVKCPPSCHELLATSSTSNPTSSLSRSQSQAGGISSRRWQDSSGNGNGNASYTAKHRKGQWACAWAWAWSWAWLWAWPLHACVRKVRYFRSSSRSKLKGRMRRRWSKDRCRIINYRDLHQLQQIRIKCSDRIRNARNYRYFYYYNYNINDWWRRWKWFIVGSAATIISNGAL